MKHEVSNQETLAKCKELLDVWSASRPYTPTKQLGSDAEFISAVSHTIERFTLTTGMRTRVVVMRQLPAGSDYCARPKDIRSYDIWRDIQSDVARESFEVGLEETRFAKTCSKCGGSGKSVCSKCSGKGGWRCTKEHRTVYNGSEKLTHMVEASLGDVFGTVLYEGKRWIKCKCDPMTHWHECTCDNGYVQCKECEGSGKLAYEWFLVQRYKEQRQERIWCPEHRLSESFYAYNDLPWHELYDEEVANRQLPVCIPSDLEQTSALVVRSIPFLDSWHELQVKTDAVRDAFAKENPNAELRISFEHALLEQYDGIIKYDYRYEGNNYTVWINLATGAVEECENGLYASIAEETVKLAQESEKKGIPQAAIYYYCKADAISLKWGKENGTQKNRVKQYRILGAFFGGSMFLMSIVTWMPALLGGDMNFVGVVSSLLGLSMMTACLVSLNEAIQLLGIALAFGLSWLAREQFGIDFGNDLVAREGYLISLLFYAWAVVTLTTDQAPRLPGGKKGLIVGGLLAGLCASPLAMYTSNVTQTFVSVGGMFIPLVALVVFSLVRLPIRLKAGKMQRFVEKNEGNGEKIRNAVEGRKPCFSGVIHGAIVIGCILALSLLGIGLGGLFDSLAGDVHFSIITTLQGFGIL